MSKVQILRSLVNQRLAEAVDEVFELFERTIAEYEEQLCRSKEENERQQKLLEAVINPEVHLQTADDQQLMVIKDEVLPEQQERNSSLNQETPPEPAHIKKEQEEMWKSQEREQLQEGEDDVAIMFTFTPLPMKSEEEDEEKPHSSQLHQRQSNQRETESERKDCGGSGAERVSNPHSHLQSVTSDKTSVLSGSDTDHSDDWGESDKPQEDLNPQQNKDVAVSYMECNTGNAPVTSYEYASSFVQKKKRKKHDIIQTGEEPFCCSVCDKICPSKGNLLQHMLRHSTEKNFSCSFCNKSFHSRAEMMTHTRVHTGEKPFICSVCGKSFSQHVSLRRHLTVHTEEKLFNCSVCDKKFKRSEHLERHTLVHTGEKPFSCSVCGKRYVQNEHLKRHYAIHTGEKLFSCSVCGRRFSQSGHLKRHYVIHRGDTI
ncbi:zinc finger protein OZF-like [Cheilinus undulatus]|uniref:zinc finger protein OZF-like n=1 Tax=Cheilinus undulatus TaxID=241271 RepID=UPI001BD2EBAC|nr:zinc finger protein OZF-like [Cheilinus undulatus]